MLGKETLELFRTVAKLQEQKYRLAENEITFIIKNNIKDDNRIQRAIDEILEFLEDDDALLLFRRICSYYFKINPQTTVNYINYYIEEYDPEKLKFGNKQINDKINDKEKQILNILINNPNSTIPEISKITKISTATISRYLKQLQDKTNIKIKNM